MDEVPETRVWLNYGDKVYAARVANRHTWNRLLVLQASLGLGLLAQATGMISVAQDVALGGVTVTLPPWLVPVGGTWAIALVASSLCGLNQQHVDLSYTLRHVYQTVGFDPWDSAWLESWALLTSDHLRTLMAPPARSFVAHLSRALVMTLVIVLVTFVPVLAQMVSTYNTFASGLRWHALACIPAILAATADTLAYFRGHYSLRPSEEKGQP